MIWRCFRDQETKKVPQGGPLFRSPGLKGEMSPGAWFTQYQAATQSVRVKRPLWEMPGKSLDWFHWRLHDGGSVCGPNEFLLLQPYVNFTSSEMMKKEQKTWRAN